MNRQESIATAASPPTAVMSRDEAMTVAIEHFRAGRRDKASEIFSAILATNHRDADALHLLGVAADAGGDSVRAVELIRQALSIRSMPSYHSNLGMALGHLGRHAEALDHYHRALAEEPDYPEAWNNLGIALEALRRSAEAETAYRRAIAARPGYAEAMGNLGNTLRSLGRTEEALAAYQDALLHNPAAPRTSLASALQALGRKAEAEAAFREDLALHPDSPEALNNLAAALGQNGQIEEAADLLPRATALAPNYPEAHANLGQVLQQLGRMEEAVGACTRALELRPDYPEALTNLGNALRSLDRLPEAELALRRALALRPMDVGCYNNLAITLQAQCRPHEALAVLDLAAALDPDDPETRHHRAMLLLRQGRLLEGWEDYEWRTRIRQSGDAYKQFSGAQAWRGEALEGQTILLVPEQGLGDTLQFLRYAPLLAARGAKVILGAQRPLTGLLRSLDGDIQIVGTGDTLPRYDFHCELLSLPRGFATTLETIPSSVPYLRADAAAMARWQDRLHPDEPGLRVGIVWAGNPKHLGDRHRSIALPMMEPLFGIPGTRWFSLQVGPRTADLVVTSIEDLSPDLTDFAETAAAIMALDLVITVDTSVAHLAGALGRPVWTLLARVPDWRWMHHPESTPWYPTMRLFRQDGRRDWVPVIETLRQALLSMTR